MYINQSKLVYHLSSISLAFYITCIVTEFLKSMFLMLLCMLIINCTYENALCLVEEKRALYLYFLILCFEQCLTFDCAHCIYHLYSWNVSNTSHLHQGMLFIIKLASVHRHSILFISISIWGRMYAPGSVCPYLHPRVRKYGQLTDTCQMISNYIIVCMHALNTCSFSLFVGWCVI